MKRCMAILIILVLGIMVCAELVAGQQVQGQGEEPTESPEDEFLKQLLGILSEMLNEKDEQKLAGIKSRGIELVRGNLLLIVQFGNTFLDDGIRLELAGDGENSEFYFMLGRVIAGLYENAAGNTYLTDKAALFNRWNKEEKEKYLEAEKYYVQGEEDREKYSYETAVPAYNRGLALYREVGYKEGEANTLQSLGVVHRMLDEYEKARERYEQGLVIFRDIKDRLGEANTLQSLGDVYYQLDDYKKARERYEQGLVIYRYIKDRLGEANTLNAIGDIYRQSDEYGKSQECYERALVIFREIKAPLGEPYTLLDIGEVYRLSSKFREAMKWYESSLVIFQKIRHRLGIANSLYYMGNAHLELSEYEKARDSYESALVIFREIKDKSGKANTLRGLGDVYFRLSEYEKARERYESGLLIFREIKDRLGEANSLNGLGYVLVALSEYKKARELYEFSLLIFRETKDRLGEANTLCCLGGALLMLSEYEKARERYESGLLIYREIKDRLGEANSLNGLGSVLAALSKYEKARKRHTEALTLQQEMKEMDGMSLTYYVLGQTFEAQNNLTSAEKEYKKSINTIESVWEELKREEIKSSYLSSKIYPYENLISVLFRQDKGPLAFNYAERSKARSFLYLLGNKRIDIKKGVPLKLVRQEEELRQKISGLTSQIMENEEKEPGRSTSSTQINNELLQSKQAHSEILEKIKLQCPEYASMISVNPLSLGDIQNLIRQTGNTVFLEYYTTPDAVYLWVLNGEDIFPYKINIKKETLDIKVQAFSAILSNTSFGVATLEFQAQELYNLLLKPVETHLAGKTRIAVIPHGVLHYLPFEALMNNGKFLEEQNITFFYLPSASVYKYCRDKNPLKKEQLIALGNPDGSLPFSEQEVKELKDFTKLEPRIFIGKEATETKVKSEGPSADILHFSCHGIFDSLQPMYSALKLAGDDKEDGSLEIQDIFQLALKPAYLVTLSACETNVGSIKSGDEIVVMSRAFIYSGTPSVLASLWKVDDYYTEKLMVSFYRALKDSDKITALHRARKEMIEKYGKRHPFYWAPFVLIGDFR